MKDHEGLYIEFNAYGIETLVPILAKLFNEAICQGFPKAWTLKTIVPIHNAVNERAWMEIKKWEAGRGADA